MREIHSDRPTIRIKERSQQGLATAERPEEQRRQVVVRVATESIAPVDDPGQVTVADEHMVTMQIGVHSTIGTDSVLGSVEDVPAPSPAPEEGS